MFGAHADLEIFLVRPSKALYYGVLRGITLGRTGERGLRDATALLNIERALTEVEKVSLRCRARSGRPMVLISSSCIFMRDDGDGKGLIELLSQHAGQWAVANLVTMAFSTEDYCWGLLAAGAARDQDGGAQCPGSAKRNRLEVLYRNTASNTSRKRYI
jgi:hypothetical protein